MLHLHNSKGEHIASQSLPSIQFGARSYNGHRGELHARLFEYAKAVGVEVRLGQNVTEYWEDEDKGEAGVICNGQRLSADMVVGADGVRSRARTLVLVCLLQIRTHFKDVSDFYLIGSGL